MHQDFIHVVKENLNVQLFDSVGLLGKAVYQDKLSIVQSKSVCVGNGLLLVVSVVIT